MGTVNNYRVRAALACPKKELDRLAFAQLIVLKMTNNPNFVSPGTVVTDLAAAATTYGTAIENVATQKNMGETRTAAKQGVFDKLDQVKAYVNGVVEKLPPDQAKAVIESAGLRTKKRSTRTKPPLAATFGGLSGTVLLVALAAAKVATYTFEYSADQKTWTACPNVMKCKTTVAGLTVGVTYYFRVQALTRKGLGDWSEVVSFVVR
jgi:hypothetical protein